MIWNFEVIWSSNGNGVTAYGPQIGSDKPETMQSIALYTNKNDFRLKERERKEAKKETKEGIVVGSEAE